MQLYSLQIKNFKSLADLEIPVLGASNLFIGRNNVGKSSVFAAIQLVQSSILGLHSEQQNAITDGAKDKSIEVSFTLILSAEEKLSLYSQVLSEKSYQTYLEQPDNRLLGSAFNYHFKTKMGIGYPIILNNVTTLDSIGEPLRVCELAHDMESATPTYRTVPSQAIGQRVDVELHKTKSPFYSRQEISIPIDLEHGKPAQEVMWFLSPLISFLKKAFFFSHFRHSYTAQSSQETAQLDNNGQNLAAVLQTLNSNNREAFERVETFLLSALPEVGRLHTTLKQQQTRIALKSKKSNQHINLSDLGGGVEQLLMIATVLETTGTDSAIFVEEPESHLHAGAQRMLAERLFNSGRQVFTTTHSPVFLNCGENSTVFSVTQANGRTAVAAIKNRVQLSTLLAEIGLRNSDILLSNAVVFVEGPSDEQVLQSWLKKAGINTDEKNISIIHTHGAGNISYTGAIRTQILREISESSPIPHLFIIDHDERSDRELNKIVETIGNHAAVLSRRELENYLLIPRAIHQVFSARSRKDSTPEPTVAQIEQWIEEGIASTRQTVLLKRIRSNIPSLKGGILPRDLILETSPDDSDFATHLKTTITDNINRHLTAVDFEAIVSQITDKFKTEWLAEVNRLAMAPGADVLDYVFKKAGYKFDKCSDAHQIAEAMTAEDIHPEIKTLCERIKNLVKPTSA